MKVKEVEAVTYVGPRGARPLFEGKDDEVPRRPIREQDGPTIARSLVTTFCANASRNRPYRGANADDGRMRFELMLAGRRESVANSVLRVVVN